MMNDQQLFSKETGRDVQSDKRPWQRQALGHVEMLAIQQGFRRRHPAKLLSNYASTTFNGPNPRTKWEDAMRRSEDLTQVPEYYKRAGDERMANQLGLVETANKNFMKSRARIQVSTPVGV
jgi:hypothetical protein